MAVNQDRIDVEMQEALNRRREKRASEQKSEQDKIDTEMQEALNRRREKLAQQKKESSSSPQEQIAAAEVSAKSRVGERLGNVVETEASAEKKVKEDAKNIGKKVGDGDFAKSEKDDRTGLEKAQDALHYVQKSGSNAFSDAMRHINDFGEAAWAGMVASASGSKEDGNFLQRFEKGFYDRMAEAAEKDDEIARSDAQSDLATDERYAFARDNKFISNLADVNAGIAGMMPSVMMDMGVGGAGGAITLAGQSYGAAFSEAYNAGATMGEALSYAAQEAMNNAIGEFLFGGLLKGTGGIAGKLIGKTQIGKTASSAVGKFLGSRPLLKAAYNLGKGALAEGAEESLQSLVSFANKKGTYDPDATVEWGDVLKEGVLGAEMGLVYGAAYSPAYYKVYRADAEVVSDMQKTAQGASSAEEIDRISQVIADMVSDCDEVINSQKSKNKDLRSKYTSEDVERMRFVKDGLDNIQKEMNANKADIIAKNKKVSDAASGLLRNTGNPEAMEENLLDLANALESKDSEVERGKSAVDKTIDYLHDMVLTADEEFARAGTESEEDAIASERIKIAKLETIVRDHREEIEERRKMIESYDGDTFPKNDDGKSVTIPEVSSTVPLDNDPEAEIEVESKEKPSNKSEESSLGEAQENSIDVEDSEHTVVDEESKNYADELLRAFNGDVDLAISEIDDMIASSDPDDAQWSGERLEKIKAVLENQNSEGSAETNRDTPRFDSNSYRGEHENPELRAALRTAKTDVSKAADDLVRAFQGDIRSAVDIVANRVRELSGGSSDSARSEVETLKSIDRAIRDDNVGRLERRTNALSGELKKYGINGIVVDRDLSAVDSDVSNARYDAKTHTVHVSPYMSADSALANSIVHESVHHAAAVDRGLVDAVLSARDAYNNANSGTDGFVDVYTQERFRRAYADDFVEYLRSDSGKAAVEDKVAGGMDRSSAISAVETDYINEEIAAHFLGDLAEIDGTVMETLKREDRSVIQRIVDAVKSFIDKLRGKTDVSGYERLAGRFEEILEDRYGVKTASKDAETITEKALAKETNAEDVSRASRDVLTAEEKKIAKLQAQEYFLRRNFEIIDAGGYALSISPNKIHEISSDLARPIPGVTIREVEDVVSRGYRELEKKENGNTLVNRETEARKVVEDGVDALLDSAFSSNVNELYTSYSDLRKILRERAIKVTDEERAQIPDYSSWRKKSMGVLRLSSDGIPLDTAWQKLSAEYPEFFDPAETAPDAMLYRLSDTADALRAVPGNPIDAGDRAQMKKQMVNAIMDGYIRGSERTVSARREDAYHKYYYNIRKTYETMFTNYARMLREQDEIVNSLQNQISEMKRTKESQKTSMVEKTFLKNLNRLYSRTLKPTNNKSVNSDIKKSVINLLKDFSGTQLLNGKNVDFDLLDASASAELRAKRNAANSDIGEIAKILGRDGNMAGTSLLDDIDSHSREIGFTLEEIEQAEERVNELKGDAKKAKLRQIDGLYAEYYRRANEMILAVTKYVDDYDKVRIGKKNYEAEVFSKDIVKSMRSRKSHRKEKTFVEKFDNAKYSMLSADMYFQEWGSRGEEIIAAYRRAQNEQVRHESEYTETAKKLIGNYDTYNAGWGGGTIETTINGEKVKVTRGQVMSLYALWMRPAGRRHIREGGAYFLSNNGSEDRARWTTYNTDKDVKALTDKLTDDERKIARGMVKFMSENAAAWGNQASQEIYGYNKFLEDSYFPIRVSRGVLPKDWERQDGFRKLENSGMTKNLKEDAVAPLVLDNFFDVVDSHVKMMAAYSAYAPLNNDVSRVVNMPEVQESVKNALGTAGWKRYEEFMYAVNMNPEQKTLASKLADGLASTYKRQAVSANISTIVKQPLSYVRALNSIESKYLVSALAQKDTFGGAYKKLREEMIENSGVAKMKILGFSDVGFGKNLRANYDKHYTQLSDKQTNKASRAVTKGYERVTNALMAGAGKADEVTWVRIWEASKLKAIDILGDGAGEKALLDKTSEIFGKIIGETQVVDTILDSPPVTKKGAMSSLTVFMNEPIKTAAGVITAAEQLRENNSSVNKKKFAKTLGTAVVSTAILEPLVSALFEMYRDEEDESEMDAMEVFSKVANSMFGTPRYKDGKTDDWSAFDVITSDAVSGILYDWIPVVSTIADTITDSVNGYSSIRIEAEGIAKFSSSVISLFKALDDPSKKTKSIYNLSSDVLTSAASLGGIPLATLRRDIRALYRTCIQATDNYTMQWQLNKLLYNIESGSARSGKNFYDIMSAAISDGDMESYQMMRKELSEIPTSSGRGVNPKTILGALEDRGTTIEIGSEIWNIEAQSRFNLREYEDDGRVEGMLAELIKALPEKERNSALPSEVGNTYTLDGEEKKIDNLEEFEVFQENVGVLRYAILREMEKSDRWERLNEEQKLYAVKQGYSYARAKFIKDRDAEYKMGSDDFEKAYKREANAEKVSNMILRNAREYKKK